jgi:hypothetical protein
MAVKVKIHFLFCENNSLTITLRQMGTLKDHGHIYKFFNHIFDITLKYCNVVTFLSYVGTDSKPLCVEFCNVYSVIFVNDLTC